MPVDADKELRALRELRPAGRRLVVRLNRLFESDGQAGIDRFVAQERRYAAAGFDVESHVRYHPGPGQEGDMAAWEAYVRQATTALAQRCARRAGHHQRGQPVPIWITENGYATNLGHDERRQVTDLESTLRSVHALGTTLGVTDYRYFNLRDNRPNGTDLFDNVGLLRADYSAKPAFDAFRRLEALFS